MSFSKKTQDAYLKEKGTRCPYCNGTDIFADYEDISTGGPHELYPTVTCESPKCGKSWVERYVLQEICEITGVEGCISPSGEVQSAIQHDRSGLDENEKTPEPDQFIFKDYQ